MLKDIMKKLTKLVLMAAVIFAVTQVPSVKKELRSITGNLESSKLNYLATIDKLENELATLRVQVDKLADVNFEQDAKLSVLNSRVSKLEEPKEERVPFWRRK